jgi:hypothetical protein
MRGLLLAAVLTLIGCGSAPEKKAEAPPPPPVKDNTAQLLPLDRTSAKVVPDYLLGKSVLPGGTIGEYEANGAKYSSSSLKQRPRRLRRFFFLISKPR